MKKFNKNLIIALSVIVFVVGLNWISALHAFSNPSPITLGTAGNFTILAGSAVTGTGVNTVTGDVGLSPTTGAAITLLTCAEMTGVSKIYDIDATYVGGGNPDVSCLSADNALATTAKTDLALAYADAASAITHPVDSTIATDLIGQTLTAGVYNSASGTFSNSGTLTLDGENDSTHIFIFKMATTLITSSSSHVVLINGAKLSNVFWVVGSSATLGSSSDLAGNILAVASITIGTSATVQGRLLADADNNTAGAVTLDGGNTVMLDIISPTSTITSPADSSLSLSATVALTGTSADTNLSATTISVDGGAFVATGGTAASWTYSATLLSDGAHTFQSKATDTSGNTGLSSVVNVTVDTAPPTVTITDDEAGIANIAGGDVIYTFTFSESVTGFVTGDIIVVGGTKGTFTPVSGTVYTLAVTPASNSTTSITVDVAGGVAFDVASNGNTVAVQSVQVVDTISPTSTITSDKTTLSKGQNATITFTLSGSSVNFVAGDVTVAGGLLSAFAGSGTAYTATFTPTDESTTLATIDVATATFTDADGNNNVAATQKTMTVNTVTPPTPPSSGRSWYGTTYISPVPPLINIIKVPSPLALPNGPGKVVYTYTLHNIGTVLVENIKMVDDSCSPVTLVSGDTAFNAKLEVNGTWLYRCITILQKTHTNTITASGWANGISATAIASTTVAVGMPIVSTPIVNTPIIKPSINKAELVITKTTFIPKFPNTGFASERKIFPWDIALRLFHFIFSRPSGVDVESLTASALLYELEQEKMSLTSLVSISLPVRLKIPKIDVDSTIEYLGFTPDGRMDAPKGAMDTGWFKFGPRPGEKGSAVIDGHSGYKNRKPAVFDGLYKLQNGDKVYVEDEKGMTTTFVVREIRKYDPKADATDVFNSTDGKAHLNLITCAGIWNYIAKSHSDRLIVFTDKI